MATQYKVKKGDTLSAIAQQMGVGLGDITGYRSGNKDLIYEGETLNIGSTPKKSDTSSSYVSEVRSQLDDTDSEPKDDIYGSAKIKTDLDTATSKRDTSFAELKDISTSTFNDEYSKRNLEEKKTKMSTLDSQIAEAKALRDQEINKVRSNPGLSAAQMTGDIKKLSDYQNSVINNLISERNSVAGEYNSELAEIDKIVENKVKDKSLDYGYYNDLVSTLTGQVGDYTKALREDLASETENDQFDRQLAQALEIAQMNAANKGGGSTNLQLKTDPISGDPLYWFNPDTGAITYVNDDQGSGGGDGYDELEKAVETQQKTSGKKWYNPLTWFN